MFRSPEYCGRYEYIPIQLDTPITTPGAGVAQRKNDCQSNTGRSKAVPLLWFLTVTCSCCPYLHFGSAIVLVTYSSKF